MLKKVLVCEDEDSIREFVVLNLQRSGYDVVDVNCGEDAIKGPRSRACILMILSMISLMMNGTF